MPVSPAAEVFAQALAQHRTGRRDEEGWREYEWRWGTGQFKELHRDYGVPQWRGEPVEGKTVLVHAEQGFGDTLQFCRYIPLLAARGAKVVLEVPGALLRLLAGLPGVAQAVATDGGQPPFDLPPSICIAR